MQIDEWGEAAAQRQAAFEFRHRLGHAVLHRVQRPPSRLWVSRSAGSRRINAFHAISGAPIIRDAEVQVAEEASGRNVGRVRLHVRIQFADRPRRVAGGDASPGRIERARIVGPSGRNGTHAQGNEQGDRAK